jgi:hypothetical protein
VRGTGLSLDSIASIFAAGTLIEGRVDQVGDELRVSVTLVDGQSGVTVQRDQYDWPMDDLASVGDALAREVSRTLRIVLGEEIRLRESRSGAPSTAAWFHLARAEKALKDGLSAVQRGTMERAVPDVDEAWALYEEFESLLPESQRPLLSGLGLTFLGGVIGRVGLPDSADAVMIRARVDQDVDPARTNRGQPSSGDATSRWPSASAPSG